LIPSHLHCGRPATKRERVKVNADGYITLQRPPSPLPLQSAGVAMASPATSPFAAASSPLPARKAKRIRLAVAKMAAHASLWELAHRAMVAVDPAYADTYSAGDSLCRFALQIEPFCTCNPAVLCLNLGHFGRVSV
jgi:hypothetical protein